MISNSSDIILEAKGISKYFGTITALERANLNLRSGEVLGVVGDNGAGKSTLMKVLSGLFKQGSKQWKQLKIAEALITTFAAVNEAMKSTLSIPILGIAAAKVLLQV